MFHQERTGLIFSIGEITLGIFLVIMSNTNRTFVVDNFTLIMALLLVVVGAALLIETLAKVLAKSDYLFAIVGEFVIGAITLTLGILALVFLHTAELVIMIASGAVLVLAGLILLFAILLGLMTAIKAGKSAKQFFESNYSAKETLSKK